MGWVFDRRRDFAIMKALGASFKADQRILRGRSCRSREWSAAILGFLIGIGVAAWIGRVNFDAPVRTAFSASCR